MSERRTTLGNVHNQRDSLALRRQSRGPGGKAARFSINPRDVHGKAHQKQAKQKVIEFLAEHRYPLEVSPKKLSSLTQKEFYVMFDFLTAFHLSTHSAQPSKTATEDGEAVIKVLKALHCPFTFTKSTLQAVSSPLYFPSVLAMLEWLVDLAKTAIKRASKKQKGESKYHATFDKGLLSIKCKGYRSYMSSPEDGQGEVFDRLMEEHLGDSKRQKEDEIKWFQQGIADFRSRAQELREQAGGMVDLIATGQSIIKATQNLKEAIHRQEKEKEAIEHECSSLQGHIEDATVIGKDLREQVERYQIVVLEQKFDRTSSEQIKNNSEHIKGLCELNKKDVEMLTGKLEALRQRMREEYMSQRESLAVYQDVCSRLKLTGASVKRSKGVNFSIDDQQSPGSVLSQVKNVLMPAAAKLCEHYAQREQKLLEQLKSYELNLPDALHAIDGVASAEIEERKKLEAVETEIGNERLETQNKLVRLQQATTVKKEEELTLRSTKDRDALAAEETYGSACAAAKKLCDTQTSELQAGVEQLKELLSFRVVMNETLAEQLKLTSESFNQTCKLGRALGVRTEQLLARTEDIVKQDTLDRLTQLDVTQN